MFEQSSYNIEPAAEPTQTGDLFHNYELKNWDYGPRLYKIAAIAGAANLLALLIVAQTSLLTMKGCDSPLVSSVCQALDVIEVGTTVFGTERDYVDAAYDKTTLSEADITYVDVSGETPPLSYPEGYFQIANPDQFQATMENPFDPSSPNYIPPSTVTPGYPITTPNTGGSLIDTTPVTPRHNPKPIEGELPGSIGDDTASNNSGKKNGKGNKTDPSTTEPKVDPTAPVTDAVVINRLPLQDFGKGVAEKVDKKEVDLAANFKIVTDAVLTPDGKIDVSIDPKTKKPRSKIVSEEGDPQMLAVVKDAISAIGDSGWLKYLSDQDITKIHVIFTQTDDQLVATITGDQPTLERAKTASSKLNTTLQVARLGERTGIVKFSDDERALLNAASSSADGKRVVLTFALPKPLAQDMINRNVQKAKEAATSLKPNGKLIEPSAADHGD